MKPNPISLTREHLESSERHLDNMTVVRDQLISEMVSKGAESPRLPALDQLIADIKGEIATLREILASLEGLDTATRLAISVDCRRERVDTQYGSIVKAIASSLEKGGAQ